MPAKRNVLSVAGISAVGRDGRRRDLVVSVAMITGRPATVALDVLGDGPDREFAIDLNAAEAAGFARALASAAATAERRPEYRGGRVEFRETKPISDEAYAALQVRAGEVP